MKIYLLLAHPDKASLNGVLADAYERAALEKGHEMRRQNLGRDVPVMLVSAADNMQTLDVPSNVIDTLRKPFFYPELIFKIKQVHGVLPEKKAKDNEARGVF